MDDLLNKDEKDEIHRINSKIHGPEYLSKDLKNVLNELDFLLEIEDALIFIQEGTIKKQEFKGKATNYWKKFEKEIKEISKKVIVYNKHVIVNNLNRSIKRLLAIPILERGNPIGVLIIFNKKINYGKDVHNTRIVKVLQSQIKFAVEKARERENLFKLFGKYMDQRQIFRVMNDSDFLKKPDLVDTVVIFADISGFTKLANKKGNEFSFEFLNKVLGKYSKIINKHNGIVDKFVGDQVIGIFGITDKINRTKNSIESALEIRNAFKKEFKKYGIGVKIGIVKGEMLYGTLGSKNNASLTVIGKDVNLASRICDHAKKGEILINEEAYIKARSNYKLKPRRFRRFKGFNEWFTIYSLVK